MNALATCPNLNSKSLARQCLQACIASSPPGGLTAGAPGLPCTAGGGRGPAVQSPQRCDWPTRRRVGGGTTTGWRPGSCSAHAWSPPPHTTGCGRGRSAGWIESPCTATSSPLCHYSTLACRAQGDLIFSRYRCPLIASTCTVSAHAPYLWQEQRAIIMIDVPAMLQATVIVKPLATS